MSINDLFKASGRPCSKVTGNKIKPNFTFLRNWETVVSPNVLSPHGVIISPKAHVSSLSLIAESSPTPVIISHSQEPPEAYIGDGDDGEEADVEEDVEDNVEEDVEEDIEEGVIEDIKENVDADLEQNTGADNDMDVESEGSDGLSEVNDDANHLMPPPAAPHPPGSGTDELPDISPIPVVVAAPGNNYQTPATAAIKRKSIIKTSTPAHFRKDTPIGIQEESPGFSVVDTIKRQKQTSGTFVPAKKKAKTVSQLTTVPSNKSDSEQSTSTISEVQLWVGAGPLRKVTDVTELDVLLTSLEDVSYSFKQKDTTTLKRKTVNEFVLKVRKEITDAIDSVQELKTAQLTLSKSTNPLKAAYRDLVQKQKDYFNLVEREAQLEEKKKAVTRDKALNDVSDWLYQLEDLQARYRDKMRVSPAEQDFASKENLPSLLQETMVNLQAAKRLKDVNDHVARLIGRRKNRSRSRHSRQLGNVLQ